MEKFLEYVRAGSILGQFVAAAAVLAGIITSDIFGLELQFIEIARLSLITWSGCVLFFTFLGLCYPKDFERLRRF